MSPRGHSSSGTSAARALFVEVYDALGSNAEARFRDVIGDFDAELATMAHHHTSRSVTEDETVND